ncbi:MAG: hypothetical protein EON96_13220 [Caulobacteraceae bacterium]|nr:MAG: hypothetical protein EON96_13220 [Caulobacteraceae bacterium]
MAPRPPFELDNEDALKQLFAATVNQQSLEEAVELMVGVSGSDDTYHHELSQTFVFARTLAKEKDERLLRFINSSGYQVHDFGEAEQLLSDFQALYEGRHNELRAGK